MLLTGSKNRDFPSQSKLAFGIGTLDYLSTQAHLYNEKQLPWKAIKCCIQLPGACLPDEAFNQVGPRAICLLCSWGGSLKPVQKKPSSPGLDFLHKALWAKSQRSIFRPWMVVPSSRSQLCFLRKPRSGRCLCSHTLPELSDCGQCFLLIALSALVFFPQ